MILEEARAELGVGPEASPDVVRRAYLKLLKTRKPEVDPQGFARLRDAYDSVKAAQEGTEAPRTQAAPEAPAPAATPADPSVPLTADQRLDAFRSRFRSLPSDAPPDMPVQVAREAVEALPEAAEARHWLIQALLAAGRKDEAVKACREAFQQGHPEFLPEFAQRFPQYITDDEILLLASMVPPPFLWGLADHLKAVGEWARMGAVTLVALEVMKRFPDIPPPQPAWFLQSILELHEHGRPKEAREIQARYAAWVTAEGLVDAFQKDNAAWAWPLIRELAALDDGCAPELRSILAWAVLSGEIDEAKARLAAWGRESPQRATESRALLRAKCPRLESALGEALSGKFKLAPAPERQKPPEQQPRESSPAQKPEPQQAKKPASRLPRQILSVLGVIAVLLVAAAIPRLILGPGPTSSTEPRPIQPPAPVATPTQTPREAAGDLCDAIPPSNQGTGCYYMEELIKAAESKDCGTVTMIYARVISNVQKPLDPERGPPPAEDPARTARIRQARASLEASLRAICPSAL